MDDFLDNYEVLGGKMRHVLPGETATGKLAVFRQSLNDDDYSIARHVEDDEDLSEDDAQDLVEEKKQDRWDCETILSEFALRLCSDRIS